MIFLIWVVTILTFVSYLPQIVKTLKTKQSEDLSISSWIMWVTGSTCYLMYSILLGDIGIIISSLIEFSLNLMILVLSIKYRDKVEHVNDIKME